MTCMKVKIKSIDGAKLPVKMSNGDWVDCYSASKHTYEKGELFFLPLGFAAQLPEGYEAHLLMRSSTCKKYGLIQANGMGIIDNSYCGDDDEWKLPCLAVTDGFIPEGIRVCQFRIVHKQPNFEFEVVESLENKSRGGFGSTGND